MLIGIDKGSAYTKTDKEMIIRSTYRKVKSNEIMLNDKNVIEINGETYILGEKGNFATDLMKSQHKNTLLFILAAICKSTEENQIACNIVTGLPIEQYTVQKEEMKKLLDDQYFVFTFNNCGKRVYIKNAEIFPEAAGAFFSMGETDGLVIDIGGLSIDTALFEDKKLKAHDTYSMGIMKLYSKIANSLNSYYDLSINEWEVENIIKKGLYIEGEKQELDLNSYLDEYVDELKEKLSLEYDIKRIRTVLLAGGGSILLKDYIKRVIPQATLIPNPQFANAIGYRNIGKVMFE